MLRRDFICIPRRTRCYALQHQTRWSTRGSSSPREGKAGQRGPSRTARILSAGEAGRCRLACYSSLSCPGEPSYPLTSPALFVTRVPAREAGSRRGQGLNAPSAGKGHRGGPGGPLTDDREVRGPLGRGVVEPVEPLPKTLVCMLPHSTKGPGVPICQLVLPGCSSFRG